MENTRPSYNLKVIMRETGIKPDTLRAWERRYKLPVPQRTTGGHRLYSQRDLETIKWLMARQKEGLSISHAVQLWRDIEENGRDPIQEMTTSLPVAGSASATAAADLESLREAWLRACMDFDEVASEQRLAQAFARHSAESVCVEILQKGLSQLGRLWYENRATVQQEHFTSALALRRVNALLAVAPPPSRSELIYLACPPHEQHVFPLLLLALLLRYHGWPIAYFGANVPLAHMESTLRAGEPALVILAAQTLSAAAETLAAARFMQAYQTPLAYGGRIFSRLPQLRQRIPGFFLGESIATAVTTVDELLVTGGSPMPDAAPVPATYHHALTDFDRQRWFLEEQVRQKLRTEGWADMHLPTASVHLAENIRAALAFGDMSLINSEIDWVRELLINYQVPQEFLSHYLTVYQEVAQAHLAPSCLPIVEWLRTVNTGRS